LLGGGFMAAEAAGSSCPTFPGRDIRSGQEFPDRAFRFGAGPVPAETRRRFRHVPTVPDPGGGAAPRPPGCRNPAQANPAEPRPPPHGEPAGPVSEARLDSAGPVILPAGRRAPPRPRAERSRRCAGDRGAGQRDFEIPVAVEFPGGRGSTKRSARSKSATAPRGARTQWAARRP
jgi:hypothetical protein